MKNIKYITIVIALAVTTIITSCNDKHKEGDGHNHGNTTENHMEDDGHGYEENAGNGEQHEEGLHLTKAQIETIGLQFGSLSSIKVNNFIKTTGVLGVPPNGYASVSAKSEGIIVETKKFVEGNFVKKGELIAYIENPNFIVKQQEYLESRAQLNLKKLDLSRQQSLVNANAGVSKSLQNAEAEVAVLEAKTVGLSKQLAYLGIPINNLTPNTITKRIALTAPMSGYIENMNIHNGLYTQPTESLMEIVSSDHLHLELDVFEKDIANIKIGQKISYTLPALGTTIYSGEISEIGKTFKSKSKTVRVHGHLDGQKPLFIKDLFINAKIWLNDETSLALPEEALIKDGNNTFIYAGENQKNKDEIQFQKIRVIPGATNNGFTAIKIIDKISEGLQIVTKGAYYVYAQSKAGVLEHEH
ncbi:efflux RND transporter periplasmic adaptor subunit [Ochrovirga pacifica]|uniref:efflux RND transporter periplasmic adaptor subunit n=1 Tax=Ochrovirga pacifica TaxID=1042376 RepID=UPI0002559B4A|nr:efflux RND transporter periplasmic adaptor subunit [Ochrovirga pacifica]